MSANICYHCQITSKRVRSTLIIQGIYFTHTSQNFFSCFSAKYQVIRLLALFKKGDFRWLIESKNKQINNYHLKQKPVHVFLLDSNQKSQDINSQFKKIFFFPPRKQCEVFVCHSLGFYSDSVKFLFSTYFNFIQYLAYKKHRISVEQIIYMHYFVCA